MDINWTSVGSATGAITGVLALVVSVAVPLGTRASELRQKRRDLELRARDHALAIARSLDWWASRWVPIEDGVGNKDFAEAAAFSSIHEFEGYLALPAPFEAMAGRLHECGDAARPLQALWNARQILSDERGNIGAYVRGDIADQEEAARVRERLVRKTIAMARAIRSANEAVQKLLD